MLVVKPLFAYALSLLTAHSLSLASGACSNWSNKYQQNIEGVCVCTASDCDEIYNGHLFLTETEVGVYQTSLAGDRLAYSTVDLEDATVEDADIVIDTSTTYQKIIGFGGAFTDASAINVYKLNEDLQQKVVDAYFSANGLQYTIGRIPIASTDFSTSIYSYNDVEGDLAMEHFSIDVDKSPNSNKLNFIKRALSTSTRDIKIFASSWAPPAWMTTENTTINCALIGSPGEEYWEALALYYSKFVTAYEAEGVNIWALTTQNEPNYQTAFKYWQSMRFDAATERDFIKLDLGPRMASDHPDLKIIILDDQKDLTNSWNAALNDADARKYVSGIGVHWYKNLDFVTSTLGNFAALTTFHTANPDLFILATEACEGYLIEPLGTGAGVKLLQPSVVWKRGEIYARDIINDLANYASGWTDWNLVLDSTGGPTWVENYVDSPILIDEESGAEFYKQPMYYVMGHFSKFLTPNSVRVALTTSTAVTTTLKNVDKVAFVTPDNQLVVVLNNRDTTDHTFTLSLSVESRHANITIPANSVQTIVIGATKRASC